MIKSEAIIEDLKAGDMRTTGAADEVAQKVLKHATMVEILVIALENEDPGVRMRGADALEKVAKARPELVQPFVKQIIAIAMKSTQQEVQWHMAQILSYLTLTPKQIEVARDIMERYYQESQSNIVKTFALDTLVGWSKADKKLQQKMENILKEALEAGSPAVKARAKKLMFEYKKVE